MDSFLSWVGGKKRLRKEILSYFPQRIDRYIEVFGGAGWILFAKDRCAQLEVFNDINSELINLYRCVKYHPEAVQKELEYTLSSREQFDDYKSRENILGYTDIQRAARYFILIRNSYGSGGTVFGMKNRRQNEAIEYLTNISKRLNKVVIENKDFENLIKSYDRKGALFYLDPPYYKAEKYYSYRFQPEDHIRLRDSVRTIKGKFLLSYNDCPYIRKLYEEFQIIPVRRQNNLSLGIGSYEELIIMNFQSE